MRVTGVDGLGGAGTPTRNGSTASAVAEVHNASPTSDAASHEGGGHGSVLALLLPSVRLPKAVPMNPREGLGGEVEAAVGGAEWQENGGDGGQRGSVVSGERYVVKLQEELGKRAPMFVDDANFIRCALPPPPPFSFLSSSSSACKAACCG